MARWLILIKKISTNKISRNTTKVQNHNLKHGINSEKLKIFEFRLSWQSEAKPNF